MLLNGWASGGLTDVSRKHFHSCSLAFSLAMELGHLGLKPEVGQSYIWNSDGSSMRLRSCLCGDMQAGTSLSRGCHVLAFS